ncbi:MAG: hypothetical protein ACM3VV_03770 [Deltaproteobacteria bacterium]
MNYKNIKFLTYSDLEISLFILIVSAIGSFIQVAGASWDITSHLLNQPELFFTPSHTLLYSGIGLIVISAGISLFLWRKKEIKQYTSISLSFKLLIIGSFLSLIAGPFDYLWHQTFGFDGLLSPTHITLATGMLINSVAVFIGLYGVVNNNISRWKNLGKLFLIPCLSSLWFMSIWYVLMFVLPFSESEFFNFNLNTYSATLIASIFLPLVNSIMFLCSSKVFNNVFGYAFIIVYLLVLVNTFSTIVPTGNLLSPLIPWYLVTVLGTSLLADILLNSRFIRINTQFKNNKLIASSIVGAIFYFFNYPMIVWTYGTFLNSNLESLNDVLPTFLNTIVSITFITIPVGAVMGLVGYLIFSKMENSLNVLIREKNNSKVMKSDH